MRIGRSPAALMAGLSLLTTGCTDSAVWPEIAAIRVPDDAGDGWDVGALEDQGFDPFVIQLLDHRLRTRDIDEVNALVIARNGVLVYEGYFVPETGPERLHQLNSVTKTVNSMVVGAAMQQGLIDGYDQPVVEFFPDAADLFEASPEKREITLRHLLTMTDGLAWDRKHPSNRERDGIRILHAPDPVRFVLEKDLIRKPGSQFFYSGAPPALLAALVHEVSGMEADEYAAAHLFGPLGIDDYRWNRMADGTVEAGGGLFLRPRDLAKLGQLYLQHGMWEGVQIVPASWVEASLQPWIASDTRNLRYGFQWWISPLERTDGRVLVDGIPFGSGYGGQKLFVVPELQIVVVFFGCTTGGYACGLGDSVPELTLWNYILSAVRDL